MSNKRTIVAAAFVTMAAILGMGRAAAVELLVSGDFETPGAGVGDVPGWSLAKFATGSAAAVNSADLTTDADAQIFLRAFEGGGPLHPAQGNFDDNGLPAGLVDGADFLTWQRNQGVMSGALPSQGDTGAEPDGKIDGDDLATWKFNYGKSPLKVNARLSQTVPASPGAEYNFQGTALFEDNYSGFVTTLGSESPFGQIPSPTNTTFRMEFLDSSGAVIGTPSTKDLRTEVTFPGFPVVTNPITATAPAGTVNVRVVAQATDMVYNGTASSMGASQSAFFNDFNLYTSANAGQNLLTNGDLNAGVPDALDFWNQQEGPDPPGADFDAQDQILRTPIASFSNHTPGGSRGVWLSAFFGDAGPSHADWSSTPVTGTISQDAQIVGGGDYTFSGWTKFEANYSGGVNTLSASSPQGAVPSPTDTVIKLEFLNVDKSQVLSTATIDVRAARQLLSPTGNANDNQWYQHVLEAVAPADARWARLTAQMAHGVFNTDPGQSAFFDDFSLQGPAPSLFAASAAVPEPTSLGGLALGASIIGLLNRRRKN
jgi:hypothetical protein